MTPPLPSLPARLLLVASKLLKLRIGLISTNSRVTDCFRKRSVILFEDFEVPALADVSPLPPVHNLTVLATVEILFALGAFFERDRFGVRGLVNSSFPSLRRRCCDSARVPAIRPCLARTLPDLHEDTLTHRLHVFVQVRDQTPKRVTRSRMAGTGAKRT